MRFLTRKRVVATALVAAFVAAYAAIGAVSRPSATVAEPAATGPGKLVPAATWYWTMAVSPSDPNVLVLGTSNGLYRSSNGGKAWRPTGPKSVNVTSVVQAGNSIVVGGVRMAKGARSPIAWKGSSRVAPDGTAVLAASADGGSTWRGLRARGLPNAAVQTLVVDPAKSSTLYAVLNTGGFYRSTDGGRSFRLVSSKLGVPPWALAITEDGEFVAGNMESGHYLSTNGRVWRKTTYRDSEGDSHVMAYAVQPTDLTRVLMTSRGVELSTDGGKSWEIVLRSKEMFGPVAWAPSESDVAYAVGFDRSLWRTDDSGSSWAKVS